MNQLDIRLSPPKLTALFHISRRLTEAVIDKEKLRLLTPLQRVSEKVAVQDMLPKMR